MKLALFAAGLSLLAIAACATERTVAPVVPSGAVPGQLKMIAAGRDTSQAPLWILNGKIINPPTDGAIDVKKIETVEVLKGKAAIDKYGPRALNGVVIITTKS